MKRFLLWVAVGCWCLGSGARAAEPVDDFVKAYGLIQQADAMQAAGQATDARDKYQQAQALLQTLHQAHPDWNPKVIQFRLHYVAKKLEALPSPTPVAAAPAPTAAPTEPTGPAPDIQRLQQLVAEAEQRIQQLESQRSVLEARLREALTAQPAAVDPRALAKAEARVLELQKENDLLKVTLQQEQAKFAQAITGTIQQQAQTELAAAREQLAKQAETLKALQQERDLLQQRLQALEAQAATAHADLTAENATLRQQLAERDALQRHLQRAEAQWAAERALTEKLRAQNDALEQKVAELIALRNIHADNKTIDLTPPVAPEEHSQLLRQLAQLQDALQAARTDAAEQRARAQQLADANAALETRLRALAQRQQEASAATDQFEQRLAQAQSELAAAQARLTETQARANQLASANQALEAQLRLAHLALAGEDSRDVQARLGAQLEAMQEQVATEHARAAKLLTEKTALERRVQELEAAAATAQAQVSSLQEQLNAARAEAAAARALVAQLQAAVAELEQQRRAWDLEHARLDIKLASAAPGLPASSSEDAQKVRQLEEQREQLQRRVAELTEALHLAHEQADVDKTDELKQQIEALQAKLAAYEAQRVPYTPEELALFNKPGASTPPPEARQAASPPKPLPPEAQELIEAARAAFAAGRFEEAANYSRRILQFDQNHPVALANLAAVEIEQRRFEEAEQHLRQALAAQPNDAHAWSQLGYLKFLQEQPDAAIEALGRAVKLEPDRAEFQNYLGLALNQKGLRAQAESALRRAVQLSPGYASAHYNLAVMYAQQHPPFGALARWHYQRALQAGHPPNPEFEQLLEELRNARATP